MSKPYLYELSQLDPGNELYSNWMSYALSLTKGDILIIVKNGLTYQAESLRSMVREIIGGGAVRPSLIKKLDAIVLATKRHADTIR